MEENRRVSYEDTTEIDLKELFFALLNRWYLICFVTLLGGLLGFLYVTYFVPETFRSKTSIYIYNQQSESMTYSDLQMGTTLTKDYEVLVKSRTVLEQVAKDLNLNISYEKMNSMVKVSVPSSTRIVEISVETTNPQMSQSIADAVREISSKSITEVMGVDAVNVVETANLPKQKAGPSIAKYTMLGAVLGGVLVCGIIVLTFLLNDTIRTQDDVEKYLDLSTLGVIPMDETLAAEEKRRKKLKKNKRKEGKHANDYHKQKG